MENKYYIPSYDEFFVGFEYETRDTRGMTESGWNPQVFGQHNKVWDLTQLNKDVRVKYLDASDIEELGFMFEEQVVGKITFKYTKNNFIELHKLYTTILILNNGRTIFEGFIKNKSELIRLLGWLNV